MIATKDLSNSMLVSAWNVLMFSLRTISDKADLPAKIAEVKSELDARSIPNVYGKKIISI